MCVLHPLVLGKRCPLILSKFVQKRVSGPTFDFCISDLMIVFPIPCTYVFYEYIHVLTFLGVLVDQKRAWHSDTVFLPLCALLRWFLIMD